VIGEGNMVEIPSYIVPHPGECGIGAIHLFRFQGDKIVELCDINQPVPADSSNRDGMF
jgi:hypothetical protein